MNNGFKENFQWVTLVSVAVIYAYYFATILPPAGADVTAEQLVFFGAMVILLVLIQVAGAVVLMAVDRFREPQEDERDRLINLSARRNVSWVLTLAVCAAMLTAFLKPGNFWVLHALLAGLVLAQLVESATVIFHYRRGF